MPLLFSVISNFEMLRSHSCKFFQCFSVLLIVLFLTACASSGRERFSENSSGPPAQVAGHHLVMESQSKPLTPNAFLQGVRWADVILVGEDVKSQDDREFVLSLSGFLSHSIQGITYSFENLDLHEQPFMEDYLKGDMELEDFLNSIRSSQGANRDTWLYRYQPLVENAKFHQNRIMASGGSPAALMAESIYYNVSPNGTIVHLVDRRFIENDEGIVSELLAINPELKIITITTGDDGMSDVQAVLVKSNRK